MNDGPRLALCLVALLAALPAQPAPSVSAPARQAVPQEWTQRLQSWLDAVADHRPGQPDAPAFFMGAWSMDDLNGATTDLLAVLSTYARMSDWQKVKYRDVVFGRAEMTTLLRMQKSDSGLVGADRLLLRTALLHADIAMRIVPQLGGTAGCSPVSTITSADGTRIGAGCIVFHWQTARTLLGAVSKDPTSSAAVRLWYHATSAFLLQDLDYANATFHIDQGQAAFPGDPAILFEHGLLHEAQSSSSVQSAMQGIKTSVPSADANLKEARNHLASAVRADPAFAEARVHLARVLGALGRHEEAEAELSRALLQPMNTRLTYYAELFLGDELRMLGRRDDARALYERAADTVPQAQSPRIALGFLSRQAGDRAGALRSVQLLLSLPPAESFLADPWWTYYRWQGRSADALLRDFYAIASAPGRLP